MFNRHDITRDTPQLDGSFARCGYDWWWHSFTGHDPQTGEEKSFFIEFYLCNPARGGEKPVLGQHPSVKREKLKPSYLMVKVGTWGSDAAQVHKFYGWKRIHVDWDAPFSIQAGDCFLTENATRGIIRVSDEEASRHPEWMCKGGEMSWSLLIDKKVAFNVGYGASRLLRRIKAFQMFWHAEGMKTEYRGEVLWNGRRYVVSPKNCNGYADKNWGSDFTSPWVWLSSCNLRSEKSGRRLRDSVFDIGGGCPKIGPFALKRKLLSAFWYEGRCYEFNFSKFWTFCRTKFVCKETKTHIIWHVDQRTLFHRMVTDISCRKNTMLLLNYESPDGARRHRRLWNGGLGSGKVQLYRFGTLVDSIIASNVGCEYGEYTAKKTNFAANKGGTIRRGRKAEESPDRKGRSAAESAGRGNLGKAVTEKNRR